MSTRRILLLIPALVLALAAWTFADTTPPSSGPLLGFSNDHASQQRALEARFDSHLDAADLRDWMKRLVGPPAPRRLALRQGERRVHGGPLPVLGLPDPRSSSSRSSSPPRRPACSRWWRPTRFTATPRRAAARRRTRPPARPPSSSPPTTPTRSTATSPATSSTSTTACRRTTRSSSAAASTSRGRSSSPATAAPGAASSPRWPPSTAPSAASSTPTPPTTATSRATSTPRAAGARDRSVQRGSVADMPLYSGDPLTPGVGATENAKRLDIKDATTLTKIPVLPISYGDALPLLKALAGPMAPEGWRGSLPHPLPPRPRPGAGAPQAGVQLEPWSRSTT